MRRKAFIIFLQLAIISLFVTAQVKKPDGSKKAIICLTYDDGLDTQLSNVIPQLDAAGLKATFFLNSIHGSSQTDVIGQTPAAVIGWMNAAKNGHELANHTLFHACPAKLGWDSAAAIDNYTIDKLITEINAQNIILSLLDPSRKKRAYAFPCNNSMIRNIDYSKIIKEKQLVTFARTGGDSNSVITDFKHLDPMRVPSWQVWTGSTLQELIAFAEKVKKAGGMGIYQIHGVGGQIFQISKETHKAFLEYLKTNQNDYWVTTFSEAMEFVTKQ